MKISKETILYICLLSAMIVNMDHGILPACSFEIKMNLGVSEMFIGFLGSVVFAGIMAGSITRYSEKRNNFIEV